MAIVEIKQRKNTYLAFAYRDGDGKIKKIYCGKKGLKKTEANIKKAKQMWYDVRLAKLQEKLKQ